MIDFESDFNAIFDREDFAVTISYRMQDGHAGSLAGLFDDAAEEVDLGEPGFIAPRPMITCPASALPAGFTEGDEIEVAGIAYRVAFPPQLDGAGLAEITLERVDI